MKINYFTLFILSSTLFISSAAKGAEPVLKTMNYGGEQRSYYMYIPEGIKDDAPLVVMLHGYGGKAENYRPEMRAVADESGFALCVPQGEVDTTGKTGWNVGYPSQKGLKRDDVGFVKALVKRVVKDYGLSKKNVFLTGMSNGGEMCYLMATKCPDTFAAYAPIAGLTMEWIYKDLRPKKAVPLMEVHGTLDKTSRWNGDPLNEDGWGKYIAVPLAVGRWSAEGRCTYEITEELPLRSEESNKVVLHRFVGCNKAWKGGPEIEVQLYEVIGGKHSWALGDMDTCRATWEFFSKYLR